MKIQDQLVRTFVSYLLKAVTSKNETDKKFSDILLFHFIIYRIVVSISISLKSQIDLVDTCFIGKIQYFHGTSVILKWDTDWKNMSQTGCGNLLMLTLWQKKIHTKDVENEHWDVLIVQNSTANKVKNYFQILLKLNLICFPGIPQKYTRIDQTDGRKFTCDLNDYNVNPPWIQDLIRRARKAFFKTLSQSKVQQKFVLYKPVKRKWWLSPVLQTWKSSTTLNLRMDITLSSSRSKETRNRTVFLP